MGNYNKGIFLLMLGLIGGLFACQSDWDRLYPESISITISNASDFTQYQVLVQVSAEKLLAKNSNFNPKAVVVLDSKGKEIPSQFELDRGLLWVLDSVAADSEQAYQIRFHPTESIPTNYAKRTQAELSHKVGGEWQGREYLAGTFQNIEYLRVPDEHKDHSWYLRYEGPGWESDKVGYRFYLDQRNAVDVFGKKVSEPVLQQVGLDGFDSYHTMQDWGMDVLKVGKSLGVGSLGAWVNNKVERVEFTDSLIAEITANGTEFSSIKTKYFAWKTAQDTLDLQSEISIHAGTRLSRQQLKLSQDLNNFATGLNKDSKAQVFINQGKEGGSWGYLASFGPQSLNKDNLGIAVLFNPAQFQSFDQDQHSHVVLLASENQTLDYYFLAAWEGELDGIRTEEAFLNYLQQVTKQLAQPIKLHID